MIEKWNTITDISQAKEVQVFSGGACNLLDNSGNLLRNVERDIINDWLTGQGITFYDPQIHPDTHGVEYDYSVHHQLELAARQNADICLFEISPRTFGGVSSLEIALEEFKRDRPTIIFFSDGNQNKDGIPAHSADGYPLFEPYGIRGKEEARRAHYREMVKNADRMRKYLMVFAQELHALTVTFGDEYFEGDVVIGPKRMHAANLFQAVVKAAGGRRVMVTFTGDDSARDEKGNPIISLPDKPREVEMQSLLDQYVDEGHALRRAISELIRVNVYVRVVYTQTAAIHAIEEMLRLESWRGR